MTFLPDILPIIPLNCKVLLPSVVLKISMRAEMASALSTDQFYKADQQKPLFLACIPLKPASVESSNTATKIKQVVASDHNVNNMDTELETSLLDQNDVERLYTHGCVARILQLHRSSTNTISVVVKGVVRFQVESVFRLDTSFFMSKVKTLEHPATETGMRGIEFTSAVFKARCRHILAAMIDLNAPDNLTRRFSVLIDTVHPVTLADMMVSVVETTFDERLWMLSTGNVKERFEKVFEWMTRQLQVFKIIKQIHLSVETKLTEQQREIYLQTMFEDIKNKLGNTGEHPEETEQGDMYDLTRRIAEANLPMDALIVANREIRRLRKLQPSTSEWYITQTYLDLIASLPWRKCSEEEIDIQYAKQQLENDHYGFSHVQKRIVEYLCVNKIKGDLKAPIICFVGPPGVGKTSLSKSIAIALSRKFHRISLGGIRDEADIRGHRRTYVGAMPGLIIQGLCKCGVNNPLMLLDEIDKLALSTRYGDPAAALLEVLDPEQNSTFSDHYLNIPFDLSRVLFIATANTLDTIPEPLLDRMEVIQLDGYTFDEKLRIARAHLLPKQMQTHGLENSRVVLSDDIILKVAERYTRESGVRSLERAIAAIMRSKCVELTELREKNKEDEYNPNVQLSDLAKILGLAMFEKEVAEREPQPGVVTGLAYSGSGNGGILLVESTKIPGNGELLLTGSLGDVMKESAMIALSWVKTHAYQLKVSYSKRTDIMANHDVHIHFPNGSVPMDGPSAGVTLVSSLVSLFTGLCVAPTIAMTGEMSLRGQVLPVGSIKEKAVSAHRAGIRKIILPHRNRKDVEADVPESVKRDIEFSYANTIWDVLQVAFAASEKKVSQWHAHAQGSHL